MKESPDQKPIHFKALTDGLGFHPFANGLPYAPQQNFSKDTGAYSAGKPSFVTPQKTMASQSLSQSMTSPVQRPSATTLQTPLRRPEQLAPQKAAVQSTPPQSLLHVETHYGFEYVMKRFLAFFVDSFLNISLSGLVLGFCLWKQSSSFDFMMNAGILFVSALFLLFFNWASITAQEVALHTSLGKKFFGLQLNGSLGQILARALLFIPSLVIFGMGILWGVFSDRRKTWYDIATGIQPEEVAEL